MSSELLNPAEMARADAEAVRLGCAGLALMEAAGRAVARAVARLRPAGRILVLCGPGNNGGDGYVASRRLAECGWPVTLAALAPPRAGTDVALAAKRWRGPSVAFRPEEAARAGLVIDAVFGAGLTRSLAPVVVDTLQAAPRVLAVDVPSGLDGATGAPLGPVRACEGTVTFFRKKPGHLLLPGRLLCGALTLADIGMPASMLQHVASHTWENQPGLWRLPEKTASGYKYTSGHVTVLGGAEMTGAARLAAAAARRIGAGLVTIAAEGSADIYRMGEPGVMVDARPLATLLEDVRRNAWVCGPGLGVAAAARVLPPLLAAGRRVVVDADGLTAAAGAPERLLGATVLTPHMGEFTRVFGAPGSDRLEAVRAAARRVQAVVLLKGADTIIAAPDGRAAINASAPPWLATAGSGDVLAGIIAGLLAQDMPAWEAACAGVWLHGQAAARLGPGMVADDLPAEVRGQGLGR
jgi:hydroxyethylthiazole kinase-like uncharacterized protein yjeF